MACRGAEDWRRRGATDFDRYELKPIREGVRDYLTFRRCRPSKLDPKLVYCFASKHASVLLT